MKKPGPSIYSSSRSIRDRYQTNSARRYGVAGVERLSEPPDHSTLIGNGEHALRAMLAALCKHV